MAVAVSEVAVVGDDYAGLRPSMAVAEGDRVRRGQLLFTDKKTPGARFTSPGTGTVRAIHRGEKRHFESIVVALDERDADEGEPFAAYEAGELARLDRMRVEENLVASGLWTALRRRPFERVPPPGAVPRSIFVTAIDTEPLAPDPAPIVRARAADFAAGLAALARLTDGPVYLCHAEGADLPAPPVERLVRASFAGPHPAGLPGTHMHFLDPVGDHRVAWHVGYQDVIAIGHLFLTGRLDVERIVSVAGPGVARPRIVRTRLGASIPEVAKGATRSETTPGAAVLSGSPLSGRLAEGTVAFLGRFHRQISVLPRESGREFLGWLRPGFGKFSVKPAFAGALAGSRRFPFTTSTNGSRRAMVPVGSFEKVMPLDILPTFLLRALASGDDEQAAALGALELAEEDLALCSYVCPGKEEWGALLRDCLDRIEREG